VLGPWLFETSTAAAGPITTPHLHEINLDVFLILYYADCGTQFTKQCQAAAASCHRVCEATELLALLWPTPPVAGLPCSKSPGGCEWIKDMSTNA
jgi:hypothetical protein